MAGGLRSRCWPCCSRSAVARGWPRRTARSRRSLRATWPRPTRSRRDSRPRRSTETCGCGCASRRSETRRRARLPRRAVPALLALRRRVNQTPRCTTSTRPRSRRRRPANLTASTPPDWHRGQRRARLRVARRPAAGARDRCADARGGLRRALEDPGPDRRTTQPRSRGGLWSRRQPVDRLVLADRRAARAACSRRGGSRSDAARREAVARARDRRAGVDRGGARPPSSYTAARRVGVFALVELVVIARAGRLGPVARAVPVARATSCTSRSGSSRSPVGLELVPTLLHGFA